MVYDLTALGMGVDAYLRLFATLEQLASYDDEARTILSQVADRYRRLAGSSG